MAACTLNLTHGQKVVSSNLTPLLFEIPRHLFSPHLTFLNLQYRTWLFQSQTILMNF